MFAAFMVFMVIPFIIGLAIFGIWGAILLGFIVGPLTVYSLSMLKR